MIIWFVEIPFVLLIVAGIILGVVGSMLVKFAIDALVIIGLFMMSLAIPLLLTSAGLMYVNKAAEKTCDKVMYFVAINGGILFVTGFLLRALIGF